MSSATARLPCTIFWGNNDSIKSLELSNRGFKLMYFSSRQRTSIERPTACLVTISQIAKKVTLGSSPSIQRIDELRQFRRMNAALIDCAVPRIRGIARTGEAWIDERTRREADPI